MEVASPLTFQPAGSKRSFACSPPVTSAVEMSDDYSLQQSKRRRFETSSSSTGASSLQSLSPFQAASSLARALPIGGPSKRSRTEYGYVEVNNMVEQQASEIQSLKTENSRLSASLVQIKADHEKITHENRLLKKLVTHQHEKQNQAQCELDAARKYKDQAEERMTKMEQMILQLRYHLQAQANAPGNDFMGFRPPDVY